MIMEPINKIERTLRTLLWSVVLAVLAGLLISLLTGCAPSPTAPIGDEEGDAYWGASPTGMFRINPGDYGTPHPQSGVYAEDRWRAVGRCLGLSYTPRGFEIRLRKIETVPCGSQMCRGFWSPGAGWVGGRYYPWDRIEVMGDPAEVQSWKHEMMHYLLDVKEGNFDGRHERGGLVEYYPGYWQGADWLRCTAWEGGQVGNSWRSCDRLE